MKGFCRFVYSSMLVLIMAWGLCANAQTDLLYINGDTSYRVGGIIRGAAAYLDGGRLHPIPPGGSFYFSESADDFADVDADIWFTYRIRKVLDPSIKRSREQYSVEWKLYIDSHDPIPAIHIARTWRVGERDHHFAVQSLGAVSSSQSGRIPYMARGIFQIDELELDGGLIIHVFQGEKELRPLSRGWGDDPYRFYLHALNGDIGALRSVESREARKLARKLKPEQLNAVVRNGDIEVLKYLINSRAKYKKKDRWDYTTLYAAVEANRLKSAELLVARGVNSKTPDNLGVTPLTLAIELGHGDMGAFLLKHVGKWKKQIGKADVKEALLNGHVDILDHLLAHGAEWPREPQNMGPMLGANIKNGDVAVIKRLLGYGVSPDVMVLDSPALVWAVANVKPTVVDLLLGAGATVDLRDISGNTALMYAAGHDRLDMLNMLIEAGAAIDAENKEGKTALLMAMETGGKNTMNTLLRLGASDDVVASHGETALWNAIYRSDYDLIARLLAAGARVKNRPGKETLADDTFLSLAIALDMTDVVESALEEDWREDDLLFGEWSLAAIARRYQAEDIEEILNERLENDRWPMVSPDNIGSSKGDPIIPVRKMAAAYPADMLAAWQSGETLIEAYISPEGYVALPRVVRADHPSFGQAGLLASLGWAFQPSQSTPPVWRKVKIPFKFSQPELASVKIWEWGVDQVPALVHQERPVLPDGYDRSDAIYVSIIVDDAGNAYTADIRATTNPALNPAILSVLQKWKFRPGVSGDMPVWTRYDAVLLLPEGVLAGTDLETLPIDRKVSIPRMITHKRPVLPDSMRSEKKVHIVLARFMINSMGFPRDIQIVTSSSEKLHQAVIDAISMWEYETPARDVRPEQLAVTVPVLFIPPGATF